MPGLRGVYRDPRTIAHRMQKPKQLNRLLLSNSERITTSRLPRSALERVLKRAANVQRHYDNVPLLGGKDAPDPIKSVNDGQIVAVKDNFVTRNLPTTCASHILEGFVAEDATAVKLLQDAGMSVVAKTNMDEFGMGSHSIHSAYGPVGGRKPKEALSVGGSSGGSALAVATGLVDSAIGSDTGGSVRLPAAYTGIVGFKPSYGMISRKGLVPYANSLDTVGIFGNSCLDVWILYSILAQHDRADPTSLSGKTRSRIWHAKKDRFKKLRNQFLSYRTYLPKPIGEELRRDVAQMNDWKESNIDKVRRRIGVPIEYNIAEMHPSVRKAWIRTLSDLQHLGHHIIPVSLPSTQQALSAYYVLAPAEASSNLAKYDGVRYGKLRDPNMIDDANGTLYSEYRGSFFGEEVKRRILLGSFTLSAGAMDNYFIQAQKVRRIVQSDFNLVFRMANPLLSDDTSPNDEGIDYLVCPTAPTPPPKISEVKNADPLDSYINDVFTVPASLAGLPAISVPVKRNPEEGLGFERSIGMQVIGQFGDDAGVIHFARRWLGADWAWQNAGRVMGKRPLLK